MTTFECPELAGVRVLVVDDDEDGRDMLATILIQNGAVVSMAGTAAEALEVFSRDAPRVVLSDIGLPEEDGYSLLLKVRALEAARARSDSAGSADSVAIVAIALSGYGGNEERRRAREGGFDAHFTKPIPLPELFSALRKLLQPG